jgi:hypothetical protein
MEPSLPRGIRMKATTLRSYIKVLTADGLLESIAARVPAETAALLAEPPLASSWFEWKHMVAINDAIEGVGGMTAIRDLSWKAIVATKGLHSVVVEGFLRICGVSPASFFKRMTEMAKHAVHGIEWKYTPIGAREGIMEAHYHVEERVHDNIFVGGIATYRLIFDFCGIKPMIHEPERIGPTRVRYRFQW